MALLESCPFGLTRNVDCSSWCFPGRKAIVVAYPVTFFGTRQLPASQYPGPSSQPYSLQQTTPESHGQGRAISELCNLFELPHRIFQTLRKSWSPSQDILIVVALGITVFLIRLHGIPTTRTRQKAGKAKTQVLDELEQLVELYL